MLFERKNLVDELLRERERMLNEQALLQEVHKILAQDEETRVAIRERLGDDGAETFNNFDVNLLESSRIFHINQIQKICIDYRLRFLSSHLFKNHIPDEAVSNIKNLEKAHNITLNGFMIMAPSKQFHLKNYDDPLLFATIGNGYYYLIHQWGNDLTAWRKTMVRPFRDFGSLLLFLAVASFLFTLFITKLLFTGDNTGQFIVLAFLFTFKAFCGIALYYCFWKGKNFNTNIWNSEFYNK
ncbi:hypothetical protein E0W68_12785 [Flavobacterium salilacus subsp. salilacus]|uniref:hypothetical protein n=1 Tax=Flavobacterium TaxID=237 RepID=UPI0010754E45|nr:MULTISPECIES: hypothetical protein [Flavobacterium]KAF2515821.1 hypothetical protein E0W68_12785 [Flavobacterium salilacus subsp. salilacus]MBE1615375.1 hypothetical protein [Flavobacterium sp. SaA2.13]